MSNDKLALQTMLHTAEHLQALLHVETMSAAKDTAGALSAMLRQALAAHEAEKQAGPVDGQASAPEVPPSPHTKFVLNKLRSALNGMLTFFGMDEDENSKAVFDDARLAYNYAAMVMRPLEPWERQSLEDFRACVHRWHEKAIAKGYDGVEAMCDTALPYGARDLRLVSTAPPSESDKEDAESALQWLYEEGCDLRSEARSDDDYGYVVVEHYMAKPHERVIGRGDKPLDAIRAARAKKEQAR